MATSGRRFGWAVVVVVVLAGAVGCTPASPGPAAQPSPVQVPEEGLREACRVTLTQEWQAAFDAGMHPREPGEYPFVKLVAGDGSLLVEYGFYGAHHELRWLPAGDGDPVVIKTFGAGEEWAQVGGASFDGRYLVYSVTWEPALISSWTLYVWDSQVQDAPRQVAESGRDEDGELLPGPFQVPVAYDGVVAFVQATGTDSEDLQENALYLYRIEEDRHELVHTGHSASPIRFGEVLLLPESTAPGALARLRGFSFTTGDPVEVPEPLAQLKGAGYFGTDEGTIAWVDSRLKELWVWRTSWDEPWLAIASWEEDYLEWVHVAGEIVVWHGTVAQFALDLRSGSYTQITPEAGFQDTGGSYLYVAYAPEREADGRPLPNDQTVIDTRQLPPLPSCS